jgi:integrase
MSKTISTDASVKAIHEPGEYRDEKQRGLILRCWKSSKGVQKAWCLRYRADQLNEKGERRQYRLSLGRFPETSLKDARERVMDELRAIDKGDDPQADKRKRRRQTAPMTLESAVHEYIEKKASKDHKKWKEEQRLFENHLIPILGKMPLASIQKADLVNIVEDLAASKAGAAREVLKHSKQLFAWCEHRGLLSSNPISTVTPKAIGGIKYTPGRRVLNDAELRIVWLAAGRLNDPFGSWVRMLILTGQRRSEVAQMRWRDLELGEMIWTIPVEDGMTNKTAKEHSVPLSSTATEIIETSIKVSRIYVFATVPESHIQGYSKAKQQLNGHITDILTEEGASTMTSWTFHDVRRSVATGLGDLGVAPSTIEAVQNRAKGVADTYNKSQYLPEKRAALDAWARHINGLIFNKKSNIIDLLAQK